ncbi:MAG: class I SAM-dependent methyltransferase [Verrucomicrobia bacterium]|nr:class I SAM-dependent methyltransferase [Verrucomicrobiota bacterium]
MEPRDTAAAYDRIGQHWAGAGFPASNGIAQHERALAFCPSPPRTALDAGCGSSGRIVELLLRRGCAVEGLDLSARMLALAREKHPSVTFHHADLCTWVPPHAYDFISAWDSVWHVPLDRQRAVLTKLCGALNPGGVFIFTSGGVDGPDERTGPCHGVPLYHAAPGIPALLRTIDEAGAVCRHLEFDQWPESHLYLIVQRPA